MNAHSAFASGNVAVITGAADGIGLAAAKKFASLGMRVCMADVDIEKLEQAAGEVIITDDEPDSPDRHKALAIRTDVSRLEDLQRLRDRVFDRYGQVDVLMNNAGIGRPTDSWTEYSNWEQVLGVNLWGVINGVHAFTPRMIEQGTPGVIINTGSKQGITSPPGSPAYNVSKAGIKAATEALEHSLRNTEDCQIRAHLLIPGFTYTGMMRRFLPEKPDGAWTAAQVVDFLLESVGRGDFYVLCPDNDVTREVDNKRMEWAMGDLIHNRPPLSRWHPDYEKAFEAFMDD
jgi:NAD(P)-dependent dehydrogenase (short-subunit alcohol dehydrogenase family)